MSKNDLPKNSGAYKLVHDVNLSDVCIPDSGLLMIDLAGHFIRPADEKRIFNLKNANTVLILYDSSKYVREDQKVKHKYSLDQKGRYILNDKDGKFEFSGGALYGNALNGGGVTIEKSSVFVNNGANLIGNFAKDGGAVDNHGIFVNEANSVIAGNVAEVGGAVCNKDGEFLNGGTINNNFAIMKGAGLFNTGIFMIKGDSKFSDNYILDDKKSTNLLTKHDDIHYELQNKPECDIFNTIYIIDKINCKDNSYVIFEGDSPVFNNNKIFDSYDLYAKDIPLDVYKVYYQDKLYAISKKTDGNVSIAAFINAAKIPLNIVRYL